METLDNFDRISDFVTEHGEVAPLNMGQLRDAQGSDKLGIHVRAAIKNELSKRGLGVSPMELPAYQHEYVLVYRMGTKAAKLVDAINSPSPSTAQHIRDVCASNDSDVIEKIRALVCD
ncbi:MAG: hypothetical protein WAO58_08305 [Fimbriimonadaceae bacterium]